MSIKGRNILSTAQRQSHNGLSIIANSPAHQRAQALEALIAGPKEYNKIKEAKLRSEKDWIDLTNLTAQEIETIPWQKYKAPEIIDGEINLTDTLAFTDFSNSDFNSFRGVIDPYTKVSPNAYVSLALCKLVNTRWNEVYSDLWAVDFACSDLSYAQMAQMRFKQCSFLHTGISNTIFKSCTFEGMNFASFKNAIDTDFSYAYFIKTELLFEDTAQGCDFSGANFIDSSISNSKLLSCKFDQAMVNGKEFKEELLLINALK